MGISILCIKNMSLRAMSGRPFLSAITSTFCYRESIATDPAFAPIARWFKVCVFYCQFVTIYAMSFFCILSGNANTSQDVFLKCNLFQVGGVYARLHATQMVNDIRSISNVMYKRSIHYAMSNICHIVSPYVTIQMLFCQLSVFLCPQPAISFVACILNGNVAKDVGKKFTCNLKTVIISKGHFVYSLLVNNLVRVVEGLTPPSRPVFIVS